jgi:hypothetical protein
MTQSVANNRLPTPTFDTDQERRSLKKLMYTISLHKSNIQHHPPLNKHKLYTTTLSPSLLPQLNAKLSHKLLPDLLVQRIRLFSSKSLLKAAVSDTVAQALLAGLRVRERVDERNILNAIASSIADNFHEIILVESRTF